MSAQVTPSKQVRDVTLVATGLDASLETHNVLT